MPILGHLLELGGVREELVDMGGTVRVAASRLVSNDTCRLLFALLFGDLGQDSSHGLGSRSWVGATLGLKGRLSGLRILEGTFR